MKTGFGVMGCREQSRLTIGYLVVLGLNIAVWLVAHRAFGRVEIPSFRILAMGCIIAYLPLGLAGFVVDQEYNTINLHYLKVRRPEAYRAANPGAIEDFRRNPKELAIEIGSDLRNLLNDPSFERALRTQPFYKQDFDEMFQFGARSVMFGFEVSGDSPGSHSRFKIIRFPEAMAAALRFETVL